jgi:hypothetical protein
MKGHLHTDDLLRPMLDKAMGLRVGRRFTHVFVMDVPGVDHPILVTDAAINIAPDLMTKVDIVQNAIDLACAIGIAEPARRHPLGGRDGQPGDPLHGRRGAPGEDGRARADHGRAGGRAARHGQRRGP